jgi:hypothetical protein
MCSLCGGNFLVFDYSTQLISVKSFWLLVYLSDLRIENRFGIRMKLESELRPPNFENQTLLLFMLDVVV